MKVSQEVQAIFNAAFNEAKLRSHEYLTPEHILYAGLSFEKMRAVFEGCDADIDQLRRGIEAYFEQKVPVVRNNAEPIQTSAFQAVIERAVMQSQASGKDEVEVSDLIVSLYDEERTYSGYYLRKLGIKRLQLLEVLSHGTSDAEDEDILENLDEAESKTEGEGKEKKSLRPGPLERFATDLTALAAAGKLEPVIGREAEIERTIQVL